MTADSTIQTEDVIRSYLTYYLCSCLCVFEGNLYTLFMEMQGKAENPPPFVETILITHPEVC